MKLNKEFENFKSKKKRLLGSLLLNNENDFKIDFEEFSLKDKIKIIKLIIKQYDIKEEFLNFNFESFTISFIGDINIKGINRISLLEDNFTLIGEHFFISIYINDLKTLRKYYDKKLKKEEALK